jgi:hypothetical protein
MNEFLCRRLGAYAWLDLDWGFIPFGDVEALANLGPGLVKEHGGDMYMFVENAELRTTGGLLAKESGGGGEPIATVRRAAGAYGAGA